MSIVGQKVQRCTLVGPFAGAFCIAVIKRYRVVFVSALGLAVVGLSKRASYSVRMAGTLECHRSSRQVSFARRNKQLASYIRYADTRAWKAFVHRSSSACYACYSRVVLGFGLTNT